MESVVKRYREAKLAIFNRLERLDVMIKLLMVLGLAIATGISAQVRMQLPFTPVPVTLQVLIVLLSGVFLSGRFACLSQIIYLALGVIGIPWFSGGVGGISVVRGVTFGYIIGFVPASFMVGWLIRRYSLARKPHFLLLIMMTAVVIIYIFGSLYLSLVLRTDLIKTIRLAVIPFIPVDLMKAAISAFIAISILPQRQTELDR